MGGFCGVLCGGFGLLKICQLFEIYFGAFPFWEFGFGKDIPQELKPLLHSGVVEGQA
jgi:hypothetical protein